MRGIGGIAMLLLLAAGLLLGVVVTLYLRRNRESLLLAALCMSLTIYLVGIMLLIAKRGGISDNVESFLYFTRGRAPLVPVQADNL